MKARGEPKSGDADVARTVDEDIGWLDVLVDESLAMHLADGAGESDRDLKKRSEIEPAAGCARHHPIERLTAWIFEHEQRFAAATTERLGHDGPRRIQVGAERVLVREAFDRRWRRFCGGGLEQEDRGL